MLMSGLAGGYPSNKQKSAPAKKLCSCKKTLLENLVHSMPSRINAIIEAKGYSTKY